jgi:CheY-like chemotaxis protein
MTKILVVDDHADIRRLLRITLGKDFTVLEADNGAQALEVVREQLPQFVLLDVMMPGDMDGLQALTAIKADPAMSNTLVAIVSARGQEADSAKARQLGADAYFVKPFSPLEVVQWVRRRM